MTQRGRAVAALGLVVYVAAWIFGSRALYPVAVGLLLTAAVAFGWVRLASRPLNVRRHGAQRDVIEGDDVRVDLEVEAQAGLVPPTLVAHESPGKLGERRVELHRVGRRRFAGGYELRRVPRGRHSFDAVRLTIQDPFALARTALVQGEPQALVVYPRLVELPRLFSERPAQAPDGRRLLLRRPSGYELHGVREHVEGESLRNVHWRSTARRGRLMVKELEDAPSDEVAVLLDADGQCGHGEHFEVAVRAAGSILRAHARRGRRCALVVNSAAREVQAVASQGAWQRALEVLAGVEPDATTRVAALLQFDAGVLARSLELVVVTSQVDVPLADRLVQRALSRRGTSLVYVEATTGPEPQLLRLQSAGIPVAVVRPGGGLAEALGGREALVA
jgi:uncharacterized protein (DUF58 family)